MKRRLNILCLIVMLVLSYSLLETAYYFAIGVKSGVGAAMDGATGGDEELADLKGLNYITLLSDGMSMAGGELMCDSVYNEKSGTYVPAAYAALMVSVETKGAALHAVLQVVLSFVQVGVLLWAVVLFVRLIVATNQGHIFCWKNVRRLRRLGVALMMGYGCSLLSTWMRYRDLGEVFSLKGYNLVLGDAVDITLLVLGLCALIVGEVFNIGLRMKEEQDLTI